MNRAVSLPEELLRKAEAFAARKHLTLEEFLAATLAGQLAGLEYLSNRAANASEQRFQAALSHIPDVEAGEQDRF